MREINGKWKTTPGNFDTLKALQLFPSVGAYDMPVIAPEQGAPAWWMPYDDWRTAANKKALPDREGPSGVHFFIEDYRFEACWNNPERALAQTADADYICTPDFSLYTDHPIAIQVWNTYRNRWLGAYWQSKGRRVIPTVVWSTESSHAFCFDGLPRESTLAISTVGMGRDKDAWKLFRAGYRAMIERLAPAQVLSLSESFPDDLRDLAPVKLYPTWSAEKLRVLDERKKAKKLAIPMGEPDQKTLKDSVG